MKLYTYFRAMEKALNAATPVLDLAPLSPKRLRKWHQHQKLRDGLIRRMERVEFKVICLEGELLQREYDEVNEDVASRL